MRSIRLTTAVLASVVFAQVLVTNMVWAALSAEDVFPATPDPFVGDWQGRWLQGEKVDPDIAAQVVALGAGKYCIRLVPKLDMRCPPLVVVETTCSGDAMAFEEGGYYGQIKGDRFTGGRGKGKSTFEMKKVTRLSPTLGLEPPAGAIVLFDGSGLDQWQSPQGCEVLDDGSMMIGPKGKTLVSKGTFTDVKLHVEFRTPFMPKARGQQRGNSGVFLQDVYEVQILDSYGLEGYYNECGALYKVSAPHVNACAPPLEWQTYDITYRAPRHDESGKLTENPRMSVHHNGVLIHNDQEIPWITAWTEKQRLAPAPRKPGHIILQVHGNFVQFRNIWLVDLADAKDTH